MDLADRVAALRARVAQAAQRAGRVPQEVTLVAVCKTHPPEVVRAAYAAGLRDFGENRVQEAVPKIAALADLRGELRWHMVGHLQRNKARPVAEAFDLLHSLDSLRLAEALQQAAVGRPSGGQLPVLLQVNVSGEASKEGFDLPGGAAHPNLPVFLAEVERIARLDRLAVVGLMTIAPLVAEAEQARPVFRALRELRVVMQAAFPGLSLSHLSMGMSDDFEVAIEEGSTLVRIGRAIFGERH